MNGSRNIVVTAFVLCALLQGAGAWAQSQDSAPETFPRIPGEVAADVRPSDSSYPPGDVRRYGAVGDGRADDTQAMRAALASGEDVHIARPPVKYKTDELDVPSDVEIFIEAGTVIEANPGYEIYDVVFRIVDQQNVRISGYGATVQMLKEEYSGEFRHGVSIRGSINVEVEGLASNSTGGDGFYIGEGRRRPVSENVTLRDVSADNNRRQGLSIVSGKRIRVIDSRFTNTGGTSPEAGIDLEPNDNTNFMEDVYLENVITENNDGPGIKVDLRRLGGDTDKTVSIEIIEPTDRGSDVGIFFSALSNGPTLNGQIVVRNPTSIEPDHSSITQSNYDARGPRIDIHNPVSIRANTIGSESVSLGAAFLVYRARIDAGAPHVGNIHFRDPEIVDDRPDPLITSYFFVKDQSAQQPARDVHDVSITGTIDASGVRSQPEPMVYFDGSGEVEDSGRLLVKHTGNRGLSLGIANYFRTVTNAGSTRRVPVMLDDVPVGWPAVTFEVHENETLRVDPDSRSRISPAGAPGAYVESSEIGATLTLRRNSAMSWVIESSTGRWVHQ